MKRWLGWVAAATVGLAVGDAGAADRALLVGINDYRHLPKHQWLKGSVNDATSMQRFVEQYWGYEASQIKVLLNENASKSAILAGIEQWLGAGTARGDRVLFYFSGHGTQVPDQDGDEVDGLDEALLATDAQAERGVAYGFITDDELAAVFNRLRDRRVTVIVDSCHSGTVTRGLVGGHGAGVKTPGALAAAFPAPPTSRAFAAHRGEEPLLAGRENLVAWTAVSAAQLAFEEIPVGGVPGGVFTRRLIAGVADRQADRNGNGVVSSSELLDYLQKESERWCQARSTTCRLGLTPSLEGPRQALVQVAGWTGSAPPKPPPPPAVVQPPPPAVVETPPPPPAVVQPPPPAVVETPPPPPAVVQPPPPAVVETPPPPPTSTPATPPPSTTTAGGSSLAQLATEALAHDNSLRVGLEVLPSKRVRIGDTVRFRVRSPRAGYLIVLDINAGNQLMQIFPNQFSDQAGKGHRIEANRPITIPDVFYGFEFKAQEPIGKGTLLAIVSEDDVALRDLLDRHKNLTAVDQPTDYLLAIAQRLRETWRKDRFNRRLRWSLAEVEYEIAR